MIEPVLLFLTWTLMLYWIHRTAHHVPVLIRFHADHHRYIHQHNTSWHPSNLILYNNTKNSTIDLWITEVLPSMIFAIVFDAWWIFWTYYVWAAFLQETIEHSKLNLYPFTSGKWHMIHHKKPSKNFGLFLPLWDKLFGTEQKHH